MRTSYKQNGQQCFKIMGISSLHYPYVSSSCPVGNQWLRAKVAYFSWRTNIYKKECPHEKVILVFYDLSNHQLILDSKSSNSPCVTRHH